MTNACFITNRLASVSLVVIVVLCNTKVLPNSQETTESASVSISGQDRQGKYAIFKLGRTFDPYIALHVGECFDSPIDFSLPIEPKETWGGFPTLRPSDEVLDLTSGYDDPRRLRSAIENINRFRMGVSVLVLGGPQVDEELFQLAAAVESLRILVLDSTSNSSEFIANLGNKRHELKVFVSQRLWIHKLQQWNRGSQAIYIGKQADDQFPWFLDDDHLLRVHSIGRDRNIFSYEGEPLENDLLEIVPYIASLEHLDVGSANVDDQFLGRLQNLVGLKSLRVDKTNVTGTGLSKLPRDQLVALDISEISCQVSIPAMTNLELLVASKTVFSQHPFLSAESFPRLRAVDASGASITLADFLEILRLPNISKIVVDEVWRKEVNIKELARRGVSITFVTNERP